MTNDAVKTDAEDAQMQLLLDLFIIKGQTDGMPLNFDAEFEAFKQTFRTVYAFTPDS